MAAAAQGNPDTATSVYEFNVKDIKGNDVSLDKYRGHVLIIVNVASKCGYTAKHYAELNEIYDQFAESKGKSLSPPIWLTRVVHSRCFFIISTIKAFTRTWNHLSLALRSSILFEAIFLFSNSCRVELRLKRFPPDTVCFRLFFHLLALVFHRFVYPRML